jgi:hypothetical protein
MQQDVAFVRFIGPVTLLFPICILETIPLTTMVSIKQVCNSNAQIATSLAPELVAILRSDLAST